MKDKWLIDALKSDIQAAERRLLENKRIIENAIADMLECESTIECNRNRLLELGIKTKRKRPYGKTKFIGNE